MLLVCDEALRRLDGKAELDLAVLMGGPGIVRRFHEDYHEKLEENHLFPRFEKAHTLVELVGILRALRPTAREGIAAPLAASGRSVAAGER